MHRSQQCHPVTFVVYSLGPAVCQLQKKLDVIGLEKDAAELVTLSVGPVGKRRSEESNTFCHVGGVSSI